MKYPVQQQQTLNVVCVACPPENSASLGAMLAGFHGLAARHGGIVNSGHGRFVFAAFPRAESALRMALAMQRLAAASRLRIGVGSGRTAVARAHALTMTAEPGTVQLCAHAHDALPGYAQELDRCEVTAEYEDDVLARIVLTQPAAYGKVSSEFAGLEVC